jgi:hypothetical protein
MTREYFKTFISARCTLGDHKRCTQVAHMGAFPSRRRPCSCDCHDTPSDAVLTP